MGLKENVIIGKLIPAGTGMSRYKNIEIFTDDEEDQDIIEMEDIAEDKAIVQG